MFSLEFYKINVKSYWRMWKQTQIFGLWKNINILQLIFVKRQESKNELIEISNMSFAPSPAKSP